MLFTSTQYLVFLPTVAVAHFLLPASRRWAWLLLCSYVFYMAWEPFYVVWLWLATLVDYTAGRIIGGTDSQRLKKLALLLSLATELGILFTFKYYDFFRKTAASLLSLGDIPMPLPPPSWVLPVGISFYTFQSIGYLVDVYRGQQRPERHLGRFALYVAFFPQLVAGPIERASQLMPQLNRFRDFFYGDAVEGLRRILWGFVKKIVVADRLALIVNPVYAAPEDFSGPVLALATLAYAFQIYCDFSGYTDIAIGSARLFGVRLRENFRQPYFARSLGEFWTRWHMSLSTWFRDYVYIPLGGNRVHAALWVRNMLLVFLLSGLWHGAAWTFVFWGVLHGAGLVAERLIAPGLRFPDHGGWQALRMVRTFLLVNIAWVFFRAQSLSDAGYILWHMPRGWLVPAEDWAAAIAALGIPPLELLLSIALIAGVVLADAISLRGRFALRFNALPVAIRWGAYSAALWAIFLWGVLRQEEFIYFQF
jgi:alginate O-acetyltransferase complex protein AlgI